MNEVAVTGIGLVTPAGIGTAANWTRICSGLPTAATDPELRGLPVDFSCRVPDSDDLVPRGLRWQLDRYGQFALAAAQQAVADAALDPNGWDGGRVAVVLGSAAGGIASLEAQHRRLNDGGPGAVSPMLMPMFLPNMAAGRISIELRTGGPCLHTATACASGATAIGTALGLLRSGACDVALAGGADAMVTPLCAAAFAKMGALSTRRTDPGRASRPFDADRDGFVLGEGAAVLVLERAAHARARGATVHALLAGYGASADGHHPTAPHPEGAGLARALADALADAGATPAEVDHVNAHGTGTPLNDLREAHTLRRVLGSHPAVTSTKGVTGHTMGAAGAIEAAYTVLALAHGQIPPTANLRSPDPRIDLDLVTGRARAAPLSLALSNSSGFGGQNAVLVFRAAP
ncbi:beta-ketoacyl-[acyl-carrier-protein] synthase family protein [Kitasatospora mediocidica]|uniref:beta-ketoacyl-[acyl-carrier-protein] synthase family protein n=1 Tax=Kitasatospora mediocidica TaxID=58352 RepID=UPI0005682373|nr:beta-ketoacyl-[acyl-carrier-protein] synthase family protein [Kitasatospora mediocidica]